MCPTNRFASYLLLIGTIVVPQCLLSAAAADPQHQTVTVGGKLNSALRSHRKDPISWPSPRDLVTETCNVTNTLMSFTLDDNLVENGALEIPASPHGAVGVSRLVAVVNSMVEVRRKNGTLLFRDGFQSFFSRFPEANATNSTAFRNPKVIYDEHEGRFVLAVLQTGFSPRLSRIWIAVSKNETPDAISGWNQAFMNSTLSIARTDTFADVLGLAVDEEAVYITTNQIPFLFLGLNIGVRVWLIKKEVFGGFYGGGALSFRTEDPYLASGDVPTTTLPAYVHGADGVDGSVGTFFPSIIPNRDGRVNLQIATFLSPFGSNPIFLVRRFPLGILTQPDFVFPNATQLDSKFKIAAGDVRVLDAVWRNNTLWVVFTINPISGVNQGQATVRWVRCRTSGFNISVEEQGDLGGEDIAPGTHTYFPSVAVNSKGLVGYGYSASSPTTFAGSYISVGTSEQSFTAKSGVASYVRFFGGDGNRWGEYSSIAVDPTDDSFWSFNAFADTRGTVDSSGNDGRWGTAWGRWACGPPTTPAPVFPPTAAPVRKPCGLFGLQLFCPLTLCGVIGSFFGLCRS